MDLHFKVDAPRGADSTWSTAQKGSRRVCNDHKFGRARARLPRLRLKLTYFPEFQGDRTVNVFESTEERLECDIDAKDCKGDYLGVTDRQRTAAQHSGRSALPDID